MQCSWLTQRRLRTLLISSCIRRFFVSRVDPSEFSFRVDRSLYKTSKFGLHCKVDGSTGKSMLCRLEKVA